MTSQDTINFLKTKVQNEKGLSKKSFILIQKTVFNNHLSVLNNINIKNAVYTLKQTANPSEDINGFNLTNVKNFICKILFNFQDISEEMFASSNIENTENILDSLKKYLIVLPRFVFYETKDIYLPFFPFPNCANAARIKPSKSPSKTPPVSDVS